jgi:hypothetical protein
MDDEIADAIQLHRLPGRGFEVVVPLQGLPPGLPLILRDTKPMLMRRVLEALVPSDRPSVLAKLDR